MPKRGADAFYTKPETCIRTKEFFRPYFDNAPVYGYGPSLEEFTRDTPLTVGTVEQVIERTLG